MNRRVVLTGRAVVSPLGVGLDAHWSALVEGRGAISHPERTVALGLPATRGCAVAADAIQPHLGRLQRKQQKLYNRATLLGMLGASLAMEDAGLAPGGGDSRRLGVVLGVNVLSWDLGSMTQYLLAAEAADGSGLLDMSRANRFCMHSINPLDFSLKTLPNLAAGHMAIAHEAQGMCRALTEGSLGGAHAIGEAYRAITAGELDAALCGGTDALLEELVFSVYDGVGFLASDDGGRPGFVAAEGSGLLVLEEAERARQRGATVYGEVIGFATAAGEGTLAARQDPTRLADRIAGTVESALDTAGCLPDVVSLHGDGNSPVDAAEEMALAKVLGGRASGTPMIRLKKAHGDMGAASGAVEFLACSALLQHAIIPSIVSVGPSLHPVAPTHALVLSLGQFGEAAQHEHAKETLQAIEAMGGHGVVCQADVGDGEAVGRLMTALIERSGRLDILVNNAGIIREGLLIEMAQEEWSSVLRTNLDSLYHTCRLAARHMLAARWGRIINISSALGTRGGRGQVNYAASKGGVNALTHALATELAPRGVTVNAIAPGLIETDMSRPFAGTEKARIRELIPMRRVGQPTEVASLAVYLASEEASYLTGQVIAVDGGIG